MTRYLLALLVFLNFVILSTPCTAFVPNPSYFPARKSNFRKQGKPTQTWIPRVETTTKLALQQNATQEESTTFWDNVSNRIEDSGLLVSDLFAIAIASQLMGLLDVLNDPEFMRNGGWFQSIPVVPLTLGVLVQRFSTLGVVWILVSIARKDGFSPESVASDEIAVKKTARVLLDFSALRILAAFAVAQATHVEVDFGGVLRECYFVGLAVSGFRLLYGQYLR
jgi:hypothetical protein